MKVTIETEEKLRRVLCNWVEVADSTPSNPQDGVVLTYSIDREDDDPLVLYVEFYENDFLDQWIDPENLGDLGEAEEALGYDTIVDAIMYDLKGQEAYTEENAQKLIKRIQSY